MQPLHSITEYKNQTIESSTQELPEIVKGTLTICQFYEISDEIDLIKASQYIAKPTARRQMSMRVRQAESIQIAQPPLQVEIGMRSLTLADHSLKGILRSSIYDLGAIALSWEIPLPSPTTWQEIARLMRAVQDETDEVQLVFSAVLEELETVLRPAMSKPRRSSIVEDYSIIVVERLATQIEIATLAEHPLIWAALLGEERPLSPSASRLLTQISYYQGDLALLGWNGALLIEPDSLAAATALYLIEFANVELLLMRSYDDDLDAQLLRMYRQLPKEQPRFALPLVRHYSYLLYEVQRLVVEFTEVTERVDNALKVTDDVYWNRFYSAMLEVLRVDVWRSGVEHKLALLRETYSMLHDEADVERAAALEWTIVLLILFEIIMALLRH